MRYRKKVFGKNMIEVLDYHTSRTYRKNGRRVKKQNLTPEQVKRNNEKQAQARLRILIDLNFNKNDYYLTLTYKKQPTSWEQAKKDIQNFIRRIKNKYKKQGKELKYIYVAEGKSRIHFHVIINRGMELFTEDFEKLWTYGMHKLTLYQGEAEDAVRLASYFIKEKRSAAYSEKEDAFKRRWGSSKNLEKPKVKREILKPSEWSNYIQPPKGYYVDTDSIIDTVSDEGYPYRFYRLIKVKGDRDDSIWSRSNFRNDTGHARGVIMRN